MVLAINKLARQISPLGYAEQIFKQHNVLLQQMRTNRVPSAGVPVANGESPLTQDVLMVADPSWQQRQNQEIAELIPPPLTRKRLEKWVNETRGNERQDRQKIKQQILSLSTPRDMSFWRRWLHRLFSWVLNYTETPLRVYGDFVVADLQHLTSLPGGLQINGNFKIFRCPRVTCLPGNLLVAGSLELGYNDNLRGFRGSLTIGLDLVIWECPKFTDLLLSPLFNPRFSSNLVSLPEGSRSKRFIRFYHTGFRSYGVEETFRQVSEDIDFGYTVLPSSWEQAEVKPLLDELRSWYQFAEPPEALNHDNNFLFLTPERQKILIAFLRSLKNRVAYNYARPKFVANVLQILQLLRAPGELETEYWQIIAQGLLIGEASGMKIIKDLNLATAVYACKQLGDRQAAALQDLAKKYLYLDIMQQHVQRRIDFLQRSRKTAYAEEIYLAFSTWMPAARLPWDLHYRSYIGSVPLKDLQRAEKEAEAALKDERRFLAFLDTWEPWKNYQREKIEREWQFAAVKSLTLPECVALANSYKRASSPLLTLDAYPDLVEPVLLRSPKGQEFIVYEFAGLKRWCLNHGTHPLHSKQKLDFTDLRLLPPSLAELEQQKQLFYEQQQASRGYLSRWWHGFVNIFAAG